MTQWIIDLLDQHPTIRQEPGYYVDWVHGVLVFGDYRVGRPLHRVLVRRLAPDSGRRGLLGRPRAVI